MKPPHRRQFLRLAASIATVTAVSRIAWAQSYPTRPVRVIVPFAPGGGADIVARLMSQWFSEQLDQPFIVENRPGASSNLAAEAVMLAPPDGHTLLLGGATNAINTTLYTRLSFDFIRDFAPVVGHKFQFRVKPQLGWRGIVDCEVLEVDQPRKLSYSWQGDPKYRVTNVTWLLEPTADAGVHQKAKEREQRDQRQHHAVTPARLSCGVCRDITI